MKALKYLTYVPKLAGFVSALKVIPFAIQRSGCSCSPPHPSSRTR